SKDGCRYPLMFGRGLYLARGVEADKNSSDSPSHYTTTNLIEKGVDEPDFIKNTGKNIFIISKRKLEIIKSWPADKMTTLSTVELPDDPQEMVLLGDDKLALISHYYKNESVGKPRPFFWPPFGFYRPHYRLTVFNITNLEKPYIEDEYRFSGQYMGMRHVGGRLLLVHRNYIGYPSGLITRIPGYENAPRKMTEEELSEVLRRFDEKVMEAVENDKRILYSMTAWQLLGLSSEGGPMENFSVKEKSCRNIYLPKAADYLESTTITSIFPGKKRARQAILVTDTSHMYVSPASIYLSQQKYRETKDYLTQSHIHKFKIHGSGGISYQGSAGVPGNIMGNFAMNEHDGYLRTATTLQRLVQPEVRDSQNGLLTPAKWVNENQIQILSHVDGELKVIGQTPRLAEGERIYSVRFEGKRGFLVTFRQVDPLFAVDLSDPSSPKVAGELKIPGFSSYLHMIDETHLLGVGREGDESGRTKGIKLSLFDVSDLSKPREVFSRTLSQDGWSEALFDHKAVTYDPLNNVVALPVSAYQKIMGEDGMVKGGYYKNELVLVRVDAMNGFNALGTLAAGDPQKNSDFIFPYYYGETNLRSVFADGFVYAISGKGITSASLLDVEHPLSVLNLQ
ncbi:MAG: beta-propeller domain-containing protein, partial [Oligoflexales bacterium]|nr:beta-propeller domain-containing protein [Oligoflexales bacterium]